MKCSSAKAKGRRLATRVRYQLLNIFLEHLTANDIRVTPSGSTGSDLELSEKALEYLPYDFECKNVEKLNIWAAIKQSKTRIQKELENNSSNPKYQIKHPLVIFSKNNHTDMVAMEFSDFKTLLFDKFMIDKYIEKHGNLEIFDL